MNARRLSSGATLAELVLLLALLGMLLGVSYGPLVSGLDRLQARSARDVLAAAVARTRSLAVAHGGAVLVIEPPDGRFWVESVLGDTLVAPLYLRERYGVRIEVDGVATSRIMLRFDGLGIGRMTNRTFRIHRGRQVAQLTLSAYGRPRSW